MRLNRSLRRARPVSELTPSQLSALTSLELAGALTPRELADVERVQPPTMTKVVAKLEEHGLVQRAPHPTDGRQVVIDLTPAAQELRNEEVRAREAWLSGQLQELSTEERAILREAAVIMDKLASG